MITVSYRRWGKKFTREFEPGDYDAAFAYAKTLLLDDQTVTISK